MAAPTRSVGFIVFVRLVKDSPICLRYLEWNHPSAKVSELETLDSVNLRFLLFYSVCIQRETSRIGLCLAVFSLSAAVGK